MKVVPAALIFGIMVAGAAIGHEVQQPAAGSPDRKAILDGLRENEVMRRLSAEWKAKIVFSHVTIRQAKDWAWVVASAQTEDEKHIIEPLSSVMREKGGRWQVVEFISDEVAPADNPEAAYRAWRAQFMGRHPDCPARIFPEKFD
ncbi:MAG: hypothetical protein ABI992_12525 [Chthoniobacterales bacterium]